MISLNKIVFIWLILVVLIVSIFVINFIFNKDNEYNNISEVSVNDIHPPSKCKGYFREIISNLADDIDKLNAGITNKIEVVDNVEINELKLHCNREYVVKPILGTQSTIGPKGFRIDISVYDSREGVLNPSNENNLKLVKWEEIRIKIIACGKYYLLKKYMIILGCGCGVCIEANVDSKADQRFVNMLFDKIGIHLNGVSLNDIQENIGIYKNSRLSTVTQLKIGITKDKLIELLGYPKRITRTIEMKGKAYREYQYVIDEPFQVANIEFDINEIVTKIRIITDHVHDD